MFRKVLHLAQTGSKPSKTHGNLQGRVYKDLWSFGRSKESFMRRVSGRLEVDEAGATSSASWHYWALIAVRLNLEVKIPRLLGNDTQRFDHLSSPYCSPAVVVGILLPTG